MNNDRLGETTGQGADLDLTTESVSEAAGNIVALAKTILGNPEWRDVVREMVRECVAAGRALNAMGQPMTALVLHDLGICLVGEAFNLGWEFDDVRADICCEMAEPLEKLGLKDFAKTAEEQQRIIEEAAREPNQAILLEVWHSVKRAGEDAEEQRERERKETGRVICVLCEMDKEKDGECEGTEGRRTPIEGYAYGICLSCRRKFIEKWQKDHP